MQENICYQVSAIVCSPFVRLDNCLLYTSYNDVTVSVSELIGAGSSAVDVLKNNLPDKEIPVSYTHLLLWPSAVRLLPIILSFL